MDEKWEKSRAKQLLSQDIITGKIPNTMTARQVYEMRKSEYEKWPFKKFSSNFYNLRKSVAKLYQRMQVDVEAYGHGLAIRKAQLSNEPPKTTPWHKSNAKNLLKQDVLAGKHSGLKPKELQQTRDEYKAFDLKVFRDQIYQITKKDEKQASRIARKKTRSKFMDASAADQDAGRAGRNLGV